MNEKNYTLDRDSIADITSDISEYLHGLRLNESLINETSLLCEELIVKFNEQLGECCCTVSIYASLGGTVIKFRVPGKRVSLEAESEHDLGAAIISRFGDKVSLRYRSAVNTVTVLANQPYAAITAFSVLAFIAAIPIGFAIRYLLPQFSGKISDFLYSAENMFSKALGVIATPITFFSLSLVVTRNFSIFENRINYIGVLLRYMASSFAAALIGYLIASSDMLAFGAAVEKFSIPLYNVDIISSSGITKLKYLLDLVPESIFAPFTGGNLVQVLLCAILFGSAAGTMGHKGETITDMCDSLNNLFCRMLSILAVLFPVMTFIATLEIILAVDYCFVSLGMMLLAIVTVAVGSILMCLLYAVALLGNGLSPISFIRNIGSSVHEISRIGSSIDAVPYAIRSCHRYLGIPLDFLDFTIPLGANINMDGNCISLMVVSVMLLGYAGVKLSPGETILLFVVVVLLSIGAPNQPGSATICFAVLFPFLGLSYENISVIIIMDSLAGMGIAAFNVVGDMVTAVIVAKRAGLIDGIPDRE